MADLVAWATVQGRLGLGATDQTEATALIAAASQRANTYTGRHLAAETVTKYLDGKGATILDLGDWPINTVTSVHIDADHEYGDSTAVTDYSILSVRGHLYRASGWTRGYQNIKVVTSVGYTTVPDDLEESIIQLVGYWLQAPQIGWLSNGDAASGGYQTQYVGAMDLPYQVRNVWDSYRRVAV